MSLKKFEDNDRLHVDMLVTPNMYPLPNDAIIVKNYGTIVINSNGQVLAAGDHMEVEFKAIDFLNWTKDKIKFIWLKNKQTGKFNKNNIIIRKNNE